MSSTPSLDILMEALKTFQMDCGQECVDGDEWITMVGRLSARTIVILAAISEQHQPKCIVFAHEVLDLFARVAGVDPCARLKPGLDSIHTRPQSSCGQSAG